MLCLLYPSAYLSVKVEGGGVGRYGWYGRDAKAQPSEAEFLSLCSRAREGPGEARVEGQSLVLAPASSCICNEQATW